MKKKEKSNFHSDLKSQIIFNKDVQSNFLLDKKIGIIGYGNQGRAQALNLKDSGYEVKIGLRDSSKSIKECQNDELDFVDIFDLVSSSDIICLLVPDAEMSNVYNSYIENNLSSGQTLLFSHGYAIHYNVITPPDYIDVVMVAPSGGGSVVRDSYVKGSGVPNLLAVYNDFSGISNDIVKEYSKAIGGTRAGSFFSTFSEETETDLFGEQSILTGCIPYIINSSFKVLLEHGYSPIVAWFVCYYELKTIVDLFHDKGIDYLYNSISDTAKYGGMIKGRFLLDNQFEKKLHILLSDIKNGKFHEELTSNNRQSLDESEFKELNSVSSQLLKILKNRE